MTYRRKQISSVGQHVRLEVTSILGVRKEDEDYEVAAHISSRDPSMYLRWSCQ